MRLFGIIGYPLGHSFSPAWFAQKFAERGITDAEYRKFELSDIDMLPELLRDNPELQGFSVTIPYKERIIPYLDRLSPDAEKIGAVNCVVRNSAGLTGHNTDWLGFRDSLAGFIGDEKPGALVLGTGGAAKAIIYSLDNMGLRSLMVSRTKSKNEVITYEELSPEIIASYKLIINATPLGTFPNIEGIPPLPYELFTPDHRLFDLVYNPPLTAFLAEGARHGCRIINGEEMLHNQAEAAWKLFGL